MYAEFFRSSNAEFFRSTRYFGVLQEYDLQQQQRGVLQVLSVGPKARKKFTLFADDAPLSRQPLVKGERLVRFEVSAAMAFKATAHCVPFPTQKTASRPCYPASRANLGASPTAPAQEPEVDSPGGMGPASPTSKEIRKTR